jgi:hypothetical protein
MTRYRHTGMHENILLVVTERPGIDTTDLAKAVTGQTLKAMPRDTLRNFNAALQELFYADRIGYVGNGVSTHWRLTPPSDRLSARLRRFLLSFPGIPRYGRRTSQKGSTK